MMTGKPFQALWLLLGALYMPSLFPREMKYWLLGQGDGQGLSLKIQLQSMVMDPRHSGFTPRKCQVFRERERGGNEQKHPNMG